MNAPDTLDLKNDNMSIISGDTLNTLISTGNGNGSNSKARALKYRWVPLSKKTEINLTKLIPNNLLSIRFKNSKKSIPMGSFSISDNLKDILLNIIDHNKFSENLLKYLSNDEKKILKELFLQTGIIDDLDIRTLIYDDKEERDNFEKLKGSILAGNNNPDILKQFKRYLFDYLRQGKISKNEAFYLLASL